MTTVWLVAFGILCAAVLVLALVVGGLLRRVLPLLEQSGSGVRLSDLELGAQIGSRLPRFTVFDLQGNAFVSSDVLARLTLVLMMSGNCPACAPLAERLRGLSGDLDGVPLAVLTDESNEDARAFSAWGRVFVDRDGVAASAFANKATPQAYLVADEIVLDRTIPGSTKDLRRLVRPHLGREDRIMNVAL